jgi:predicted ribosomally synthesized peptide with SipW-like signal peptide
MRSIFLVVAIEAVAGYATWSYFTDSATSNDNTFSSGTLSITNTELTTATTVTIPNMAPGDVSAPFSVIIRNDGTINLGWLGDWQFSAANTQSEALYNALYIADAKMEFLAPNGTTSWLDDATSGYEPGGGAATDTNGIDHFIANGTGSGPYSPFFTSLANASMFNVVNFNSFNNNGGMLPGSVYEHAGALKPGYSYKLTVRFGMAPLAGNEYQNLGPITAKLQVNATQIIDAALQAQGVPAASAPGTVTWMNAQIADQTE